jgi:hypothetical protein
MVVTKIEKTEFLKKAQHGKIEMLQARFDWACSWKVLLKSLIPKTATFTYQVKTLDIFIRKNKINQSNLTSIWHQNCKLSPSFVWISFLWNKNTRTTGVMFSIMYHYISKFHDSQHLFLIVFHITKFCKTLFLSEVFALCCRPYQNLILVTDNKSIPKLYIKPSWTNHNCQVGMSSSRLMNSYIYGSINLPF